MILTIDLYMDRESMVAHPEATLRHALNGMSFANVMMLQENESLNLYDPKSNVVGAVYIKSIAGPLLDKVLDDAVAVGLGKNTLGE